MKYLPLLFLLSVSLNAYVIVSKGTSMLPAIPDNSLLKVKLVPYEKLEKGAVVLYLNKDMSKDNLVAHRLLKKIGNKWVAKGDNNKEIDLGFVDKNNYRGVVELVPIYQN